MSLLNLLPRQSRQTARVMASMMDIEPEELLDGLRQDALAIAKAEVEVDRRTTQKTEAQLQVITRHVNAPEFDANLRDSRERLRTALNEADSDEIDVDVWERVKRCRAEVALLEYLENLGEE